jgi:hypothetical protein
MSAVMVGKIERCGEAGISSMDRPKQTETNTFVFRKVLDQGIAQTTYEVVEQALEDPV